MVLQVNKNIKLFVSSFSAKLNSLCCKEKRQVVKGGINVTTNQVSLAKVREDERHNRALEPIEASKASAAHRQAGASESQAAAALSQASTAAGTLQQRIAHEGVQEAQGWANLENEALKAQAALSQAESAATSARGTEMRGQAAAADAETRAAAEQRMQAEQDALLAPRTGQAWVDLVGSGARSIGTLVDMFIPG